MTSSSETAVDSLGLIAGNRSLPLIFARQARRLGVRRLVAIAFEGETQPDLAPLVDELIWIKVGQLARLIEAFTQRGITRCVMLGQIAPKNLFDLRPDWRAITLLLKLKEKNAHTLFGAVAQELEKDGVRLISAVPWLQPLMPGAGFHVGPPLSAAQRADLAFGFRIAQEISRLDIGQTVVVKNGTVLAVEAFEGTDACLVRGGGLAGKAAGAVAVKVAKANHDFRFDIPCIGPQTIRTCAGAGIGVLALDPGKTLLLEPGEVEALACRHQIAVTATESLTRALS